VPGFQKLQKERLAGETTNIIIIIIHGSTDQWGSFDNIRWRRMRRCRVHVLKQFVNLVSWHSATFVT